MGLYSPFIYSPIYGLITQPHIFIASSLLSPKAKTKQTLCFYNTVDPCEFTWHALGSLLDESFYNLSPPNTRLPSILNQVSHGYLLPNGAVFCWRTLQASCTAVLSASAVLLCKTLRLRLSTMPWVHASSKLDLASSCVAWDLCRSLRAFICKAV